MGSMSVTDLYRRIVAGSGGELQTSEQHLRDMLAGKVNPHVANLSVLGEAVQALGGDVASLGPIVERRLQRILVVVSPGGGGDLLDRSSR